MSAQARDYVRTRINILLEDVRNTYGFDESEAMSLIASALARPNFNLHQRRLPIQLEGSDFEWGFRIEVKIEDGKHLTFRLFPGEKSLGLDIKQSLKCSDLVIRQENKSGRLVSMLDKDETVSLVFLK